MPVVRYTLQGQPRRRRRTRTRRGGGFFGDLWSGIKRGANWIKDNKVISRGLNALGSVYKPAGGWCCWVPWAWSETQIQEKTYWRRLVIRRPQVHQEKSLGFPWPFIWLTIPKAVRKICRHSQTLGYGRRRTTRRRVYRRRAPVALVGGRRRRTRRIGIPMSLVTPIRRKRVVRRPVAMMGGLVLFGC